MSEAAVELKVAGQTYRVVTSATQAELRELAKVVERALYEVTQPGKQPSPNALVLAAVTLAHELREERDLRRAEQKQHKQTLQRILGTLDEVLGKPPEASGEVSPFASEKTVTGNEVAAYVRRSRRPGAAAKSND